MTRWNGTERRRTDLLGLLHRWTYVRYVGASAFALGGDLVIFLLLLHGGMAAAPASAIGYICGIALHWLISSRFVFGREASRLTEVRNRQKLLFVGSALLGLGVTVGIVGLGHAMGIDPRAAKLVAVLVAFQLTYMLRKTIVFGGS